MKSFKEYAAKRGFHLDEASGGSNSGSSKKGNVDALTMDAKDFPIEECAPEVMKIHAAFQNPKVKNYFHELQKEQPDEKYFKFGDTPHHDRTAREIASTSREYAKNLKFEKHKLYLIGNTVKTWLQKRLHNPQSMNPEFPCSFCEGTTEWKLGTSAHPNEVWVILHQGQKDGIIPKDAVISWGDKATGMVSVKLAALRHLRKNVKINIQPFKMPVSSGGEGGAEGGESGPAARPQFGVGMDKDKSNFSKNSEALYFDIDERKVYDPTMLGISDLRSKKDGEDGDEGSSKSPFGGADKGGDKKPAGGGFGGGKPSAPKKPAFGGGKPAPKKPAFGGGDKGGDKKPAFGGGKPAPKKPAFGGDKDKGDKKPFGK